MGETETNDFSSTGLTFLYIITIIFIIIIFFTEKSNPSHTTIDIVGIVIIMILEFFMGFTVTTNAATLFLAVIVTWIVIFLPTLLIYIGPLNQYVDELNSIFSNVIGYMFVANQASEILHKLNVETDSTTTTDPKISTSKQLIARIQNSKNIFINQLTPSNFDYLWNNLFSSLFEVNDTEKEEIRKNLLEITNKKFVIGKCIWYFYTCVLAITISSFFMTL